MVKFLVKKDQDNFAGRKSLIYNLKKHGLESYLNGTSIIDPSIDKIFGF